jgi:hypothetical protein
VLAARTGHTSRTLLDHYASLIDEYDGSEPVDAEAEVVAARRASV